MYECGEGRGGGYGRGVLWVTVRVNLVLALP